MLVGGKRKSDPDGIVLGTESGNVEFNAVWKMWSVAEHRSKGRLKTNWIQMGSDLRWRRLQS